jgi:hypothetical protein
MVRIGSRSTLGPDAPEIIPPRLTIQLLGRFSVTIGACTLEERDWRLRKAATIVKLLALAPHRRLHR